MKYLMYHGFRENHQKSDRYHLTANSFEEHLKSASKGKDFTITIDDGVPSVFNIAFSIIKNYNIPTIVFIMTGMIGKSAMAKNQIKEMSDYGIKFQSHSHTHRNHNLLSREEIIDEGKRSKDIIETITNREVNQYSFPGWFYNEEICEILHNLEYNEFFTSNYGTGMKINNGFVIYDRIEVYGDRSIYYYASKNIIYFRKLRSQLVKIINHLR